MAKDRLDLVGQRFGDWAVIKRAGEHPRNGAQWLCRCVCGEERIVGGGNLRSRKSWGCGCRTGSREQYRKQKPVTLAPLRLPGGDDGN